MVNIVDPAPVIHSALPTDGLKKNEFNLKILPSAQCNKTLKNNEDQHNIDWRLSKEMYKHN